MKLKALALVVALAAVPAAAFAADKMMDCCKDCACCNDKDKKAETPEQKGH